MANSEGNLLKADSIYQPISKEVAHIMSGAFVKNSPVEPWAADVVARATSNKPPTEIWSGAMAGVPGG